MNANQESRYGLPTTVKFCKNCVISNQRPSSTIEFLNRNLRKDTISFNSNGVCEACEYNERKKTIDWKEREFLLKETLERYRSRNGSYDCIVPSSGGKDSSFTAHSLKYKYNMNPLTITWAPNIYTDVGWSNFQNLINIGGIDNILYTPNGKLHRLLTRLAFLNLGHPFQPFIHGQKITGPKFAYHFNIPLVIYGENQAEYGNKISDNDIYTMDKSFFVAEDPNSILIGGIPIQEISHSHNFDLREFSPYIPLSRDQIKDREIVKLYLGYFERWDPQECYYYAAANTGFTAADKRSDGTYSKYTEIDDKIVPFHFYTTLIKFGIGRATYDASQEIRNNKISREEGIALVNRYDTEFPSTYFEDFLNYVNISRDEFYDTIDRFRSPHLWKKIDGKWLLRHNVSSTGCDDLNS